LVVLFVLGFSGCAQQPKQVGAEMRAGPRERSGQTSRLAGTPAAAEIVEPTGVVTLKQALELALEHNPELKAFSWDIRAAEAGRLQASLRPNPSLDVTIEELGGRPDKSAPGERPWRLSKKSLPNGTTRQSDSTSPGR